MPSEIDDLYAARAGKIEKAKKLFADHGADAWTQERENEFNALHDSAAADLQKIAGLKNQAARSQAAADRQAAAEAEQRQPRGRAGGHNVPAGDPAPHALPGSLGSFRGRPLRAAAGSEAARRAAPAYVEAFSTFMAGGPMAGLETDNLQNGGYLAPPQFVADLVRELDNSFWFRGLANVLPPTSAPSVTLPRRTSRMTSFAWGETVNLASPDATLKFGAYTLVPHYMSGFNEIGRDLLRAAVIAVESVVMDEIKFNAGELEEGGFLYGDGVKKPLGVFTPSDQGIPTTRDVTGPVATDTFVDAKYSLREPYLRSPNLRWLFNRASVRALAKLKATTGEPLWLVSVRDGQPDSFLGVPLVLSEYAAVPTGTAGAYAAGDYVGMIGDFRNYDIQDSLDLTITRHDDAVFNAKNTVGYITRRKVDGNTRIAEAFARVKLS